MSFEQFRDDSFRATFSPEDSKLRLYTGRVPRECYDLLVKAGFKSTPKQSCDFVATWTPDREDVCLSLIAEDDDIGDEGYSLADRAADRAERFSGYRDNRREEASDFAERYNDGPEAFGNQDAKRADRAARKHERLRNKGVCQWSKAEYWQERTRGVISHALHKLDPHTRRGRILELEKSVRKHESSMDEWKKRYDKWESIGAIADPAEQTKAAQAWAGRCSGMYYDYPHPDNPEYKSSLYYLLEPTEHRKERPITGAEAVHLYLSRTQNPHTYTSRWAEHYKMRLEYENAMLESEGGKASEVEMEVGGFIGNKQIYGINKSPATGRITSVKVIMPIWWKNNALGMQSVNIERMGADDYRAPTQEERDEFKARMDAQKKAKKDAKKTAPPKPSLINPTPECAARLQEIWNKCDKRYDYMSTKEKTVKLTTQKEYSDDRGGETVLIGHDGRIHRETYQHHKNNVPVFKVRTRFGSIVVLTDKPQKALPWQQMDEIEEGLITEEEVIAKLPKIGEMMQEMTKNFSTVTGDDWELFTRAWQLGYVEDQSASQKSFTGKAKAALNATIEPISLEDLTSKKALFASNFEHVTDPEEIIRLYEENQRLHKMRHLMSHYERGVESFVISGTGWFCIDYNRNGGNSIAYVCHQREFNEAISNKGELVDAAS